MASMQRIYQRTAAGSRACQRLACGLPAGYRRLLQCLGEPATLQLVAQRLAGYSACDLPSWLNALEKMGLVESVAPEWVEELLALGCYEPEPVPAQG